ncbi:MAG: helix-turn-helix transcriptional regulator [Planctomycetaceae bacterium]|nr:helix-turn-helix transcriptional regulator [Planctomycetaceae bacterium]
MAQKVKPTQAQQSQWKQSVAEVDVEVDQTQVRELLSKLGDTGVDDVIDRLKALRESRGVSLRALEESSGIPRGSLSKIENHQHAPGLATLSSYAAALGKTIRVVVVDNP